MFDLAIWSPRLLAVLRIITALLLLEHATMKFFEFPAALPGISHPLPILIAAAGVMVQTFELEPSRRREVALNHAARTAFQILGAMLPLAPSLPSLN